MLTMAASTRSKKRERPTERPAFCGFPLPTPAVKFYELPPPMPWSTVSAITAEDAQSLIPDRFVSPFDRLLTKEGCGCRTKRPAQVKRWDRKSLVRLMFADVFDSFADPAQVSKELVLSLIDQELFALDEVLRVTGMYYNDPALAQLTLEDNCFVGKSFADVAAVCQTSPDTVKAITLWRIAEHKSRQFRVNVKRRWPMLSSLVMDTNATRLRSWNARHREILNARGHSLTEYYTFLRSGAGTCP